MRRMTLGLAIAFIMTMGCVSFQSYGRRDSRQEKWQGKVEVGVMAMGGETTGIVLLTNLGTFELEITDRRLLRTVIHKYEGRMVKVTGRLNTVRGVEVRTRRIIKVQKIKLLKLGEIK